MKMQSVTLKRILSLVMVFAMILSLVPNVALAAGTPEKLYLKPNSNWVKDGARFAAYYFNNSTGKNEWHSMKTDGDGIYYVDVPSGYPNVIFCRMNGGATANNWNNKWNQTGDLTVPTNGNNLFTVPSGSWDGATTAWSSYTPIYTVAGTSGLCGSEWDPADSTNRMEKNAEGLYEKVFTNVSAGTYQFKITKDRAWDVSFGNNGSDVSLSVADDGSDVTILFNEDTKAITTKVVKEYAVTFNGTNVTSSNTAAKAVKGEAYSTTLSVGEGYDLPESVSVTMGGTAVENAYNAETGVITISAVTGDVVITAEGVRKSYGVTFNGTNVTSDGAASVYHGEDYTATLTPASGYVLPEEVVVTVGGAAVTPEWNASTGALKVSAVTDAVVIQAVGVKDVKMLYLKPNTNWTKDGARFAAYFFGNGEKWVSMVDSDADGIYEVEAPEGYPKVIFCRMNGGTSANNWTNKWNQTGDLTVPTDDKNLFTLPSGSWDGATTTWSVFVYEEPADPVLTVAGVAELCGTAWDVSNTANDMVKNAAGLFEKVFTNVAAGTYEFKVVKDHSWDESWGSGSGNASVTVAENGSTVTVRFNYATKAITTEVVAPEKPASHSVTFNGTNVTSDGAATVEDGKTYTATLTAAEGYTLPETVTVTVGGTAVTPSYDAETGALEIQNVTGDVVITAVGVEEVVEPETITIYFRNDWLWTNVSVHYWGSSVAPDTTWPGAPMTKCGTHSGYDVYSLEIPADVTGIVFTGNKNDDPSALDQSPDITTDITDGSAYYMHWDNGNKCSKFDYTPAGGEGAVYYLQGFINNADYYGSEYKFADGSLTVQFTADSYVYLKDGNNTNYMFAAYCQDTTGTLTTGGTEKMFVPGNVQLTFTVAENTDGSLTLSYVQGGSGGGEEPEGDEYQVTFHFANTLNWGTVNLYTWTGSGTQQTGTWPGTAVTADGSGYYTYTVTYEAATNEGLNFIFNNGSSQTVDLKVEASQFTDKKAEVWVVLTTKDGEGKYNAAILADPSEIVVSPVVDGDTVTFNYGGDATSVAVAGTFNNWSTTATPMTKNADGVWTATVSGLVAGNYKYKFVVNGTEWILDPMNSNTEKDQDENENSVFYILSGSGVEDDNKVTIRIHYKRTDGKYDGWNLWVWGSNMGGHRVDFDSADSDGAKVATIVLDDARAHQSISFKERLSVEGNEWKDQASSDRFIDLATVVSGTIDYYIATGSCVYGDDVIRKNKVSSVAVDYDNNAVVVTTVQAVANPDTAFVLKKGDDVIPVTVQAVGSKYSLILPSGDPLDLKKLHEYQVFFEGAPYSIAIDGAYASDKFAAEFTYTGSDLGANYNSDSTTFRVWAPTAESVSVKLYSTGSDAETGAAELGTFPMTPDVNGTWIVTIDGDLKNVYYTYIVNVAGETVEANDPYSRTTGVNGKRSMVIDLGDTDPDGWASDHNPNPVTSQTDAIIYELHVRDFSIDDSSGVTLANRGKFLAFTEHGTTVNGAGTTSTGIDYLKSLGFTHLHLLPIYDYASVDETTCSNFNWGYDPQNYNVPEGSYSTNPYDGNVRVNEMKQMVQALHNAGISVVMDVVYNHVYDASTFSFNQIVPGYFSRVSSNASGCGNDTASEREMVRKYIVESVLYWTEEYHIDGFRFDLVGLLDVETINQIVTEVHAIRPDVIFYGEGWDMDGTNKEPGTQMAKQGNSSLTPGFAYFSDSMRNNLGGNNEGTATGFASGAGNGGSMVSEWKGNPWWTNNPQQVVQYASCHDNYTLADKIILSTGRSTVDSTVIKMNNLAAAFYMTSQGVPFIHAGEELLREKLNADGSRNHNSYNSPDSVNHIDWNDVEKYASTSAYYQGLIALRKAHPALRYSTAALVDANVQTREASANLIALRIDGYGAGDDDIFVIFNAASSAQTVSLPEGQWTIYVQGDKAGTTALGTASGSISVAGISAAVLTKADEGKDEKEPLGASSEKTLYFSNNKHWAKVYAYAWTDNGETILLGAWPGSEMTYVETNDYGEDIYAITLPASATGVEGVIFHNNEGEQTVDIEPGVDGTGYYCTDKNDENKYQVGTYTYRAPILGGADEYFLHGWINGADYVGDGYKFVDGQLTTTFAADAYVYVVNGTGSATYMTDGYKGAVDSVLMLDTAKHPLTGQQWDKLLIPGGTEVTLTLTVNNDNTVTLSYTAASAGVEDQSGIQNGLTLHCWNWSFEEIEAMIPFIAAQGFTAIQTSPVQPLKEATNLPGHSVGGNWWVYYQPVDFTITTDSGNALGTKDDLISMIETAHTYGVKVIVDVVANHLGNKTGNDLADAIPEYLRKAEYWHDITVNTTDYTSRFDMTQHCMGGLPDLNTASSDVQGYVLKFLKECVDAGVDGFRFDAAKHIETPKDDASFSSDFWTVVVDGAEDYAQTTYGKDLYIYGEVLDDPVISISAYTRYMAVTDNGWSNHLRSMVAAGNAGMVAGYYKSAPASQLVLWAESHDTFATDDQNQSSAGVSEADILKTWALVAARKDAMGLFFARPESMSQPIGYASMTGWVKNVVGAVNHFHNNFVGQSEAVANENGISYVVRSDSGAVLVQVSQAATVADEIDIAANGLADGTYTDFVTGEAFTVSGGRISGQIGASGIAVLAKNLEIPSYTVTVADAEGGTVTADRTEASVAEIVVVTVTPDEGKELDQIQVTTAEGESVEVGAYEGNYVFIMPASNVTVTVTFKAKAPEQYDNRIQVGQGGKAEVDKESAAAGETVTITVTPDEGKELYKLTVTDADGKDVELKALGNGKYSFTQPEGGVTVEVSFKAKSVTPLTGDEALLGLWLMLATVSAAAFVALVLDQRKKVR